MTSYIDRDISLVEFNARVLAQVERPDIPLLEQLRYLCIVSRNVDEFFEVRIAELFNDLSATTSSGAQKPDLVARHEALATATHALVKKQYEIFQSHLVPQLRNAGIRLLSHHERSKAQVDWVADYFSQNVLPLLTPIALDPSHPFPVVANKSLNFIVQLSPNRKAAKGSNIRVVKAPRVLPRVVELPKALCRGSRGFVLLTSIIRANLHLLFPEAEVVGYSQFRVTRNSDLWVDDNDVQDLRKALRSKLTTRSYGRAVRLEVSSSCPDELVSFLEKQFELKSIDTYRVHGPVNLVRLDELVDRVSEPTLRFPEFVPRDVHHAKGDELFDLITAGDLLLHHPFESFQPVQELIHSAAIDPLVLSIKITIYRTGADSDIMKSLITAARRGVEVTVVLELRARFDEATNIDWAEQLEKVGVQVIYGMIGLKTHAKMTLIHRRERKGLKQYVHLGTGNYNASTARRYTDFALMTANQTLCREVAEVFRHISSLSPLPRLSQLWVAPSNLYKNIIRAIQAETETARRGGRGRIVAKMNSLVEAKVVDALYEASGAGVEIDLIVRGACILRPGVPGLSDNIKVRSIVGRFLEHSRIYCFYNAGAPRIMMSSADWMGRNLFRRVEVAFPVTDPMLAYRVVEEGIEPYLRDTVDAWDLNGDGRYVRSSRRAMRGKRVHAHALLLGKSI